MAKMQPVGWPRRPVGGKLPAMYVITGATGNIGRAIAETLLSQGLPVRVIGRDPARLQALVDRGAESRVGSLDDTGFVRDAFAGATAVFAMIPPVYVADDPRAAQGKVGEAIAAAIEANRVPHVVHLSSLGAELTEGTGPVLGVHDQEARLDRIEGVNVLHLRPTYFMENLLHGVGMIQSMGIYGTPLRADLAFPLIATRDIAAAAATELNERGFTGSSVRVLLGPADHTPAALTRLIGAAIGKPELPYVQFPYDQAVEAMVQMGLSRPVAEGMVDLNRSMNEGRCIGALPRDERSTTPTTVEQFIDQVLAPALRGPARAAS